MTTPFIFQVGMVLALLGAGRCFQARLGAARVRVRVKRRAQTLPHVF